jgi:hypothetical protein
MTAQLIPVFSCSGNLAPFRSDQPHDGMPKINLMISGGRLELHLERALLCTARAPGKDQDPAIYLVAGCAFDDRTNRSEAQPNQFVIGWLRAGSTGWLLPLSDRDTTQLLGRINSSFAILERLAVHGIAPPHGAAPAHLALAA